MGPSGEAGHLPNAVKQNGSRNRLIRHRAGGSHVICQNPLWGVGMVMQDCNPSIQWRGDGGQKDLSLIPGWAL
jgi:hypothetical protein